VNLLPWLLDWPPRPAAVAAALLVTLLSVATVATAGLVLDTPDDETATVETVDLTLRLNDDVEFPDTNGTVRSCMASGTPGDSISVLGDVTVEVPPDVSQRGRALTLGLTVTETGQRTAYEVDESGTVTTDVFWLAEDDETLAVGDTVRLRIELRRGDALLANATERLPVQEGDRRYDCSESVSGVPSGPAGDVAY
jgi:hypothetical protein